MSNPNQTATSVPQVPPPTPCEVLRYRYHHGTNLGSVYVVEKWLTGSVFTDNASPQDTSELAAVTLSVNGIGIDATRAKFEARWAGAVTDADWDWLCTQAHCTSIRVPIGYFTLGPDFCKKTPFAAYSQVYINAWSSVKAFITRARSCGIGVLVDFHALPGGANTGEHSGTNSGQAALWGNRDNLNLSQKCLEFLANEIKSLDGVVGLQLVNEAIWGAPGMYPWYDRVIDAISKIDNTIPIYISDGWNPAQAIDYIKTKNTVDLGSTSPLSNPIIVDDHVYFCFTDANRACDPQQICDQVSTLLNQLDGKDGCVISHGAAQVTVGEWSCVLSDDTWAKMRVGTRDDSVKQFGTAQCNRFLQKSGGHYFWTYKMDWMDGGEWGFVAQTNHGGVTSPPNLKLSNADVLAAVNNATSQFTAKQQSSYDGHVNYWSKRGSGFEHWRFQNGWALGWNDALAFFSMRAKGGLPGTGGDTIGCLEIWTRKRISESTMMGAFAWEFETGFRTGVADFYRCTGLQWNIS